MNQRGGYPRLASCVEARPTLERRVPNVCPLRWRNYVIEAAGLGAFMLSALGFTLLLEHLGSPMRAAR